MISQTTHQTTRLTPGYEIVRMPPPQCTDDQHVFMWPAHTHGSGFQYAAPPGLRCQCGAVEYQKQNKTDGEPQGEPTGRNAPRVGSIAGTPANENAEGWPGGYAARPAEVTQ